MENVLSIYTDGACSGNPGPGGWGYYILWGGREKRGSGELRWTTNQRAELTAVVEALGAVKKFNLETVVYSDSAYIVNCFKDNWRASWIRNGWKTSKGGEVVNRDLWERLFALVDKFSSLEFKHVKGHVGIGGNEIANSLAQGAVMPFGAIWLKCECGHLYAPAARIERFVPKNGWKSACAKCGKNNGEERIYDERV